MADSLYIVQREDLEHHAIILSKETFVNFCNNLKDFPYIRSSQSYVSVETISVSKEALEFALNTKNVTVVNDDKDTPGGIDVVVNMFPLLPKEAA
jgi:hypothetical protein